ncbi:unnamed protein product, partial [Rotaria sordida]
MKARQKWDLSVLN